MTETIVYKFGLLPPEYNAEIVHRQMHLAHVYRNDLTHIERARRAAVREIMSAHAEVRELDVKLAAAKQALETAIAAVSEHKKRERTRQVPIVLKEAVTKARAEAGAVRKARFAALAAAREATAPALAEVEARWSIMQKAARASSGLRHGTYILVEDAMNLVRKMPLWDADGGPNDPRFVPWRTEGQIGVQIPNGISTAELDTDTFVRLDLLPLQEGGPPLSKRAVKNRKGTLWLRVGTGEHRAPIWAKFPIVVSRPFPEGARIRRVTVTRRTNGPVGSKDEWTAQFTLAIDPVAALRLRLGHPCVDHACSGCDMCAPRPTAHYRRRMGPPGSLVAVDLGWRQMDDGAVRVGTAIGFTPNPYFAGPGVPGGEVPSFTLLPPSIGERLAKLRGVRAVRDRSFNVIRDGLHGWLFGEIGKRTTVQLDADFRIAVGPELAHWRKNFPEPEIRRADTDRSEHYAKVLERAAHLSRWKSFERLHRLVEFWREHRFPGDALAFSIAEAWRYHDRHLWCWEAQGTTKLWRHQRQVFRNAAAELAAKYETLVLEDLDLSQLARTPAPETGEANDAGGLRHAAAPGRYREALINAFGLHRVVFVPAAKTTLVCSRCDVENTVGAALHFTCSGCGTVWDQDLNACHNILRWGAAGRSPVGEAKRKIPVANEGSRFSRAKKRKEAEKSATSTA